MRFLFSFHPSQPAFADSDVSVTTSELTQEIFSHLMDTPEFKFLREEAILLKIPHVYLFGGTAAALGHYAKWDVQRKKGDTRFQPDRFDYDYTNIYRSTQDADIVIDELPNKQNPLKMLSPHSFPISKVQNPFGK